MAVSTGSTNELCSPTCGSRVAVSASSTNERGASNVYENQWWIQGDIPDNAELQGFETPWTLVGPVMASDTPQGPARHLLPALEVTARLAEP